MRDSTLEIWRDVQGYEGFYQVSNLGRVWSVPRTDATNHKQGGKIMKLKRETAGYLKVNLSKNGKARLMFVHRLVATAFVQKDEGCDIVNHIDNDRANNNSKNLEWTTYKGNMQHAARQGRMKYNPENLKKAINSRKKPIIGTNGSETLRFESAAEAEKHGFNHRHIASCCRGMYGCKTHKGYEWRYAE